MSNPVVSVVIVNWNGAHLLAPCLDSLRAHCTGVSYEVIVVDNGSSDESRELLARDYSWVRASLLPENLGFSGGNNHGIRQARGHYVLLLNNDTLFYEDALTPMCDFLDRRPRVGVASCRVYEDPQRTILGDPGCRRYPEIWNVLFRGLAENLGLARLLDDRPAFRRLFGQGGDPFREALVAHVTGAFFFCRHSALDKVGLLDEGFFLFLEETDLCCRMRHQGYQVAHNPATGIIHLGNQSTGIRPDVREIYQRSMSRFLAKHRGPSSARLYELQERYLMARLYRMRRWARERWPSLRRG